MTTQARLDRTAGVIKEFRLGRKCAYCGLSFKELIGNKFIKESDVVFHHFKDKSFEIGSEGRHKNEDDLKQEIQKTQCICKEIHEYAGTHCEDDIHNLVPVGVICKSHKKYNSNKACEETS